MVHLACNMVMTKMEVVMVLVVVVVAGLPGSLAYFADWSMLAQDRQPTCVDIPANMTLCQNIGRYTYIGYTVGCSDFEK